MSTAYRSLDQLCERKPGSWNEVIEERLTVGQQRLVRCLPLYHLPDDHKPLRDDFVDKMPQRFVAVVKEVPYYVNTEGYAYCRYAFRLPKDMWSGYGKVMHKDDPKTTYVSRETFNEVWSELKELKSQQQRLAIVSFEDIQKASNADLIKDIHQLQSEAADLRTAGENLLAIMDANIDPAVKATSKYRDAIEAWERIARN